MSGWLKTPVVFLILLVFAISTASAFEVERGPFRFEYHVQDGDGRSYTPGCLVSCDLPINISYLAGPSEHSPLALSSVLGGYFGVSPPGDDIQLKRLEIRVNETYETVEPTYGNISVEVCSLDNATGNTSCGNITRWGVNGSHNVDNWRWGWQSIHPGFRLYTGESVVVNFRGRRSPRLGRYASDFIPRISVAGEVLEFVELAWWNTSIEMETTFNSPNINATWSDTNYTMNLTFNIDPSDCTPNTQIFFTDDASGSRVEIDAYTTTPETGAWCNSTMEYWVNINATGNMTAATVNTSIKAHVDRDGDMDSPMRTPSNVYREYEDLEDNDFADTFDEIQVTQDPNPTIVVESGNNVLSVRGWPWDSGLRTIQSFSRGVKLEGRIKSSHVDEDGVILYIDDVNNIADGVGLHWSNAGANGDVKAREYGSTVYTFDASRDNNVWKDFSITIVDSINYKVMYDGVEHSNTYSTIPDNQKFSFILDNAHYTRFDNLTWRKYTLTDGVEPYFTNSTWLTLDILAPNVTFVSPTPGNASATSNTSAYINASYIELGNDPGVTDTLLLEWTYPNSSVLNFTMTEVADGVANGSAWYNITGLPDGESQYRVWANDSNGNLNITPFTGYRNIYVEVTPTPPLVTIQSPTNTSYVTILIDVNVTLVEPNPDTVVAELDGTANYSLVNRSGNWNTQINVTVGSHNIRIWATDQFGEVNGTEVVYFTADDVNVTLTSPTNNTNVFQGQLISFNYTPQTSQYTWVNASLYYDGALISTDTSVINNMSNTITHLIPNHLDNRTWYIQACNDAGCLNSDTFTVNVTVKPIPTDCTGSPTGIWLLHLNITDEEEYGDVLNGTIGILMTFHDPIISLTTNYSLLRNEGNALDICVDATRENETFDGDITLHSGDSWPIASWYIRGLTVSNNTYNQTLALVNASTSTISHIYAIDCEGNQAEDYFVTILHYDYNESVWGALRMSQTDPYGLAAFNLIRDNKFYSFYVYDENLVYQQTFSNYIITTLETSLQIDVCAIPYLPLALTGVSFSCSNTSTTIDCSATDNNDPLRVTEFVLRVWRGRAVNFTLDCMDTSTSNPASLSCPITADEVYFFSLKARMNPDVVLTSGTVGSFAQAGYGAHGLLIATIFTLSLGFVGAYNASLFVLLIFVGNALSIVLGLSQPVDPMTVSLFATLSALVIWRLKPR